MKHLSLLLVVLVAAAVAACGAPQTSQRLLQPELMRGPVTSPAGRVLVITATCGGLEAECRSSWGPTVDQIVLGALEFRGYNTIDPTTLRKDERKRDEKIEESDSRVEHESSATAGGVGFIGIIPVGGASAASSKSVTVSQSRHKTVILSGANFEDLRLEDRKALMQMAGANTIATTRVVVGANYGTWSAAQNVEVIVKLATADTGDMLWSTRCIASSADYPNVENAIENAARCAASGFGMNQ